MPVADSRYSKHIYMTTSRTHALTVLPSAYNASDWQETKLLQVYIHEVAVRLVTAFGEDD